MYAAIFNPGILLESEEVLVDSLLQLNCQFSRKFILHLLSHVLKINPNKLLEDAFANQIFLSFT